MNPSIILLTICIFLFASLALIFSVYLIKMAIRAGKVQQANSITNIPHYTQEDFHKHHAAVNPVTNYKLAKVK